MKMVINNFLYIIGIKCNQTAMVKKSLNRGAEVNIYKRFRKNVLYGIIERKNIQLLRVLIEYGIDLDWHRKGYCTLLEHACIYGNAEIIELLAKSGCNLNMPMNDVCQRLAARNRFHTLKYLLKQGMKPDVLSWDGRTGLHWAAQEGNVEIVKLLIESGANVNIMDENAQTPLYIACAENHIDVVRVLLEHNAIVDLTGDTVTPLIIACICGNYEVVCTLIEHGADVNYVDDEGRTALFYSKIRGYVNRRKYKRIEEALLSSGAKISVRDKEGISIKDLDNPEICKRMYQELYG